MYFLKICVYSACVTLLHGVLVCAQISMQFDSKSFIFVLAKDFLLEWLIHYKKDDIGLNLIYFLSGIWDTLKYHINDLIWPSFQFVFCKSIFIHKMPDLYRLKKNTKYKKYADRCNREWIVNEFSIF